MSIIRVAGIVFIIHLLLTCICFVIATSKEGALVWILFLVVDFPLSWLYFPVEPIVHWISDWTFWRFVLAPAMFFQIVGTVNWTCLSVLVFSLSNLCPCPAIVCSPENEDSEAVVVQEFSSEPETPVSVPDFGEKSEKDKIDAKESLDKTD